MFLHHWDDHFTDGENAVIVEGTLNTTKLFTNKGFTICEFSASDYLGYRLISERLNRKPNLMSRSVSFVNHGWGMNSGKIVDQKPEKPMVDWFSKDIVIHQ